MELMKNKRKNKKGVFFTIICIILFTLVFTSSTTYFSFTRNEKAQLLMVTVDSMQRMLDDINSDMQRAAYITSFRAILSMEEVVISTNTFLDNTTDVFTSLVTNGSYNGTEFFLMENNTFLNWTAKAVAEAATQDFNLSFDLTGVRINQSNPWEVNVYMDLNISIADNKRIAHINKSITVEARVEIEEFEDPLYNKFTVNDVPNTIIKSPWLGNFSDNDTSVDNLIDHLNVSYYVASTQGPSFIDRFEGSLQPSPAGIESFIDFDEIWASGNEPIQNRSNVDFLYFNDTAIYTNWSVAGMPDWFRIDGLAFNAFLNRTQFYEVENRTI